LSGTGIVASVLLLAGAILPATSCSAEDRASADLVVRNARITTQDESRPSAAALAVLDGEIVAVGEDADVSKLIGERTRVINAKGRRLIPGLVDSHSHFLRSGLSYTRELRWDGVPTLKHGLEMIEQQAKRTPKGEWVRVIGGWTPWQFKERRLPTVEELNEAAPGTPVYIQYFYSAGLVNRRGLETLGINAETQDPPGGRFERDTAGVPTGLMLAEPHPGIFYGKIAALPAATLEVEANSTMHLFYELARFGLTGVIDAGGGGFDYPEHYNTAKELAAQGKLPIRTSFYLFAQRANKELEDFDAWTTANKVDTNSDPFKPHGFELDGAGEYVLWEAADFENFRWARPELTASMEKNLYSVLKVLVQRRWPFKIHATYDESIGRILDVVEKVNSDTRLEGLRWSIEHGETVTPESIRRIHALGGGLAIQNRMVFLGDDFTERYGAEAASVTPPLRAIYDIGIPVGMGTDATRGSTFNPWVSLHYLVTGETASGRKLYKADNLLTREEALRVHTLGSAWFSGEEDVKGRIAPGQHADFVILSGDYFSVSAAEIKTIRSVLTVVNGSIVFGADDYAQLSPKLPEILPEWSPVKHFGSYWEGAQ
jgi:predicted amidohydrolase YtcJ